MVHHSSNLEYVRSSFEHPEAEALAEALNVHCGALAYIVVPDVRGGVRSQIEILDADGNFESHYID